MNAPLPTHTRQSTGMILSDILADLETLRDTLVSPRLTPLEADIAREEAEEKAKRTATPLEVYDTLIQSQNSVRQVNHSEFVDTLSKWEWPEEQSQGVPAGVLMDSACVMKLWKGPDGFALKTVPVVGSQMVTEKTVYEVFKLKPTGTPA